ncbi:MAG: hypothetical protein ABSG68_18050, partial [Thermoguttaceae bacterium]
QVHVFGQESGQMVNPISRKMDQTPTLQFSCYTPVYFRQRRASRRFLGQRRKKAHGVHVRYLRATGSHRGKNA